MDTNKILVDDKIKILIYIHVCCLNNYEDIFINLINSIKESKLYDVVHEIRCGVLGIQSQTFKNYINHDIKINIIKESPNVKLYETFTVNKMINDSKLENSYILYLHTKGCTKPKNINIKSWVDYLCYFNITKWNLCINLLKDNHMVGVNLQDKRFEELHYAGNFWWTKSDYSKHMKQITCKKYNAPEFHMTQDGLGKFIGLWHSHCPHYQEQYPKELYENKEILPYELTASKKTLDYLTKKYVLHKVQLDNFIPHYKKMFKHIKYRIKNLLEIGIGSLENNTGNILKCWSEYFANGKIYCIDKIPHPELHKYKIKTFVADLTSEENLKSVIDNINKPLDIIIDGSHIGKHQVFSFMYLHKYLACDGIYVIEDVQPSNIEGLKSLSIFPQHFKEYINQNFIIECFDFIIFFIKK